MSLIRYFRFLITGIVICCFAFPRISIGEEPSLSGEFPFDDVSAVYSGPFTRPDRSDLLVLHKSGGIQFENYDYTGAGLAMGTYNLALYSFDGSEFHMIWKDRSVMLQYSLPLKYPISRTAWCYGDFENDGRYSLITCNVNRMQEFAFDEQYFEQYKRPTRKLLETPDVWIDQLIACDIDADGCDELVALEYANKQDSSGTYHIGIYKIVDKSLVPVWQGLDGKVGGNYEVVPPTSFISKCRIDGIPGEVPVLIGSESDVSPSSYSVIGKTQTGDYEIVYPFPIPRQSTSGPVGGVIFNDGSRILHYGFFLDYNTLKPYHSLPSPFSFTLLERDRWMPLNIKGSFIGGHFSEFTLEPGRDGWLFINGREYFFYDSLPLISP